jgi:hypothetical protein
MQEHAFKLEIILSNPNPLAKAYRKGVYYLELMESA